MQYLPIASASNPAVKAAKRLATQPRFAREQGLSLAEGIHLARELAAHREYVRKIFLREGAEKNPEIRSVLAQFESEDLVCLVLPPGLFASICPVEASAGIICEIQIPEQGKIKKGQDTIFLDGVQDPGNVGTIIRLSLASGVTNIALSSQCAYVWSPKVLRAAMGAHFYCNIVSSADIEKVKEESAAECLVADARGGKDLYEEAWGEKPSLWVFGSEGLGVTEKALALADKTLLIPLDPRVESLNVGTAAAVCLFEQRRRRLRRE